MRDAREVAATLGCLGHHETGTVIHAEWISPNLLFMETEGGCEHTDGKSRVVDIRDLPHLCCCEAGCSPDYEPDSTERCALQRSCTYLGRTNTNRTRPNFANDLESFWGCE
jgi:hypothetical protein